MFLLVQKTRTCVQLRINSMDGLPHFGERKSDDYQLMTPQISKAFMNQVKARHKNQVSNLLEPQTFVVLFCCPKENT